MNEHTGMLPAEVEEMLRLALVAELTVIDPSGRPITYPLIPLYDGRKIYMTSSVLFSEKLRHIKGNPKVSVALTDRTAVPNEAFRRATIQGDAVVVDDDLHSGWERLLHLWRAKEPVIDKFLKQRFGIPLFFERAVIEISPRKVFLFEEDPSESPKVFELAETA